MPKVHECLCNSVKKIQQFFVKSERLEIAPLSSLCQKSVIARSLYTETSCQYSPRFAKENKRRLNKKDGTTTKNKSF